MLGMAPNFSKQKRGKSKTQDCKRNLSFMIFKGNQMVFS